jgi:hypothetical protein
MKDKGERIIFVAAYNLHITNPSIEGEWISFSSFPFTREALDASVTELGPTTKAPKKVQGDISGLSPSGRRWPRNRRKGLCAVGTGAFLRTNVSKSFAVLVFL